MQGIRTKNIIEIKNISKHFGGVKALEDVSFDIESGSICSILGENGAGKSTLMKVIGGALEPDGGELFINGEKITIFSPRSAQEHGINIVYQELSLLPDLSIYENIFLGRLLSNKIGLCDHSRMEKESVEALSKLGLGNLDPTTKVRTLSNAQQQLVEIARALKFESRVLIMDEPTSSLDAEDAQKLLELLKEIRNAGKTVLYVTHRIEEAQFISDFTVILRDGHFVGKYIVNELTKHDIVKKMTGEEIKEIPKVRRKFNDDNIILEVKGINVKPLVRDVSFKLYKGEILGIAGIIGAGRSELVRSIFGIGRISSGEIFLRGKPIKRPSPSKMLSGDTRVCFIPEDRKKEGLLFKNSVRENIIITFRNYNYKGVFIKKGIENKKALEYKEKLDIKTDSLDQKVGSLSGGNQQKVVLARCLATQPDIIILDEPTRGIDVGAKAEIHELILKLAESGSGIIFVSSEQDELFLLCDRILVMSDGALRAELTDDEITENNILYYAISSKVVKESLV